MRTLWVRWVRVVVASGLAGLMGWGCAGSGEASGSGWAATDRPLAAFLPSHVGDLDARLNRVRSASGYEGALVYPLGTSVWRDRDRDAQPLIQAAIDGLPERGGTVSLPAGVISIEAPIRIERSNVRLMGAGRDRTVIRFADGAMRGAVLDCIEIVGESMGSPIENVYIHDLGVDANYWDQPGSYNPRAIDADFADRVLVHNVTIANAFVGLTFGLGVTEATAWNVTVTNWHNDAFNASGDFQSGGARDILFYYCTARDALNERRGGSPGNRNNAWEIEDGASEVTLVYCTVVNASGNGFAVRNHAYDGPLATGPVTFIRCVAENVDNHGFHVVGNTWPNQVGGITLHECRSDSVSTFTKGIEGAGLELTGLRIFDSAFSASVSIGPVRNSVILNSEFRALTVWSFEGGGPLLTTPSSSWETRLRVIESSIAEELSVFGDLGGVSLIDTALPPRTNLSLGESQTIADEER